MMSVSPRTLQAVLLVLFLTFVLYVAAWSMPGDRFRLSIFPSPSTAAIEADIGHLEADLVRLYDAARERAMAAGELERAVAYGERSLSLLPSVEVYTAVTQLHLQRGDRPQAIVTADRALAAFPGNADLLRLAADLHATD